MLEVGALIVKSAARTDPEKRALKENEGVFNMKEEQAKIDAMALQTPFGFGQPGAPGMPAMPGMVPPAAIAEKPAKADKKNKKKNK